MKYSYVTDEKLRKSLQRKREETSLKDTPEVAKKLAKESKGSSKKSTPKKLRTNKKFESLKAKKNLVKNPS